MKWRLGGWLQRLHGKEDFGVGPVASEGPERTKLETIQSAASWRDLNLRQRSRLEVKNL